MRALDIRCVSWQQAHETLNTIRYAVFVEEQQVPVELEIDEHDPVAEHFLATQIADDLPVATARLLENGHVGRMAVLKSHRGQQVGRRLLQRIREHARDTQLPTLFLHAQLQAAGFYEKLGFQRSGDIFMDAGIEHIRMIDRL